MKKISRKEVIIYSIFLIVIGILIFIILEQNNNNKKLLNHVNEYKMRLVDLQKEIPNNYLTEDKEDLKSYTKNSEKMSKYSWYSGLITEINNSRVDSEFFDYILSYNNPIDLASMEYLNGRGLSCEAVRREYQEKYYLAWKKEFYNVASLLYKAIECKKERKELVSYIKSIKTMISRKQNEMIINIYTCNKTPKEEHFETMYYGNGTWSWQREEAAFIYREETLNMIRQYNNYLEMNFENGDSKEKPVPTYNYITKKIDSLEDEEVPVPNYFK